MSHRRVKDLAFEGFDDEYYEDDEPTAKDISRLRAGTLEVRRVLGPDFNVADSEIEETLWYYYFDVGKSVTYLQGEPVERPDLQLATDCSQDKAKPKLSKSSAKTPQRLSPDSKPFPSLDPSQFLGTCSYDCGGALDRYARPSEDPAMSDQATVCDFTPVHLQRQTYDPPSPAKEFFQDCPWLKVPPHRQAEILIEPIYPRMGLLGGSGTQDDKPRPSKLAALAAKRRQKENERRAGVTADAAPKDEVDVPSKLQNLRLSSQTDRVPREKRRKPSYSANFRNTGSETIQQSDHSPIPPAKEGNELGLGDAVTQIPPKPPAARLTQTITPSTFASTLFGDSSTPQSTSRAPVVDAAALMYGDNHAKCYNFAEPSPDDKVLAAQKGSKRLKTGVNIH